ncbi:MAG TPA: class I SAM-dependent methyltransferase [Steroidobacteraceae bacterium]|nr:class I SAM-dependent methyltransferase [Steroidobacteraceae bacterium]
MRNYDPADEMLGGFTSRDGTIEFYNRINALLQPGFKVLDLGAGRGSWCFVEKAEYKRTLRSLKGKVAEYIGADVDTAVLGNPATDRNVLIEDGRLPLEDREVDVVICDWVLEHIVDVASFKREVDRVLKSGGYFCARTPHSLSYWTLAARAVRNSSHTRFLRSIQPNRRAQDMFPTAYRCNTLGAVSRWFEGWKNYTYLYTAEPSYYFGSKPMFHFMKLVHSLAPRAMTGSLFIFLRKP